MADGKTLELPALGRPMQLGMLYDCRDDTPIHGFTLWDPQFLKKNRYVRTQQGTQFNILASDSINDKSTALNIEASLKASLLGGLVKVKGSAEFISDKKTTSRQFRLTLHCKATVRLEQLTMKHLSRRSVQYPQVFMHGKGTHVVTHILYGAQAFFVFDRYLKQEESEQQVKGLVSEIIKKIPCFNMKGEGDLRLTESEKDEANNLKCKFHGDFAPQSNTATFQEAIAAYNQLPSMLGESGEFAVPLTVWLYPLSKMDYKAANLVRDISMSAIDHIQDIFEGLDQWKIKCDDLGKFNICTAFPKLKEKLDLSRKLVHEYKRSLQRNIAQALPKIRGGKSKEKILLDIISECEQSPFNVHQLERWVKCRQKEIKILESFMKGFESSRVIRSREDLNELLLDFSVKQMIVFSFSSVGLEDEYLKALSRYIRSQTAVPYSPGREWFESAAMLGSIKIKATQFREFAAVNRESEKISFCVMGFDDGDKATGDGGSIFLYEDGFLSKKGFVPPGAPGQPEVLTRSHDYVELIWAAPNAGFSCVNTYIVRYREASSTQDTGWSEYKTEDSTISVTIRNLRPNTTYEFSVAASCELGESQASPISNATTFPSCPPQGIRRASITVAWDKPSAMADGLKGLKYIVKSIPVGDTNPDHVLLNETEGSECLCHIENMEPNKTYSISVSARYGTAGDSEFSRPVEITATPAITQRSMNIKELIARCDRIRWGNHSKGEISVYRLPLTKGKQGGHGNHQTYCFGEATHPGKQHLVLMVVGATGAGKSTLINGMINYIFNVEWDDTFRFKIVADDGENKTKNQAQSQTQLITAYTINPTTWSRLESKLTIIDTPGFGDTRGIHRDKAIVNQIRDFFSDSALHQIDHIDVIGFVAQASHARLTPTQRYVFDSVLAIFGKDIEQNISLLATFADGQKLPVIDAIEAANIPCLNNVFKFNNSALYANKTNVSKSPGCTSRVNRHGAYSRAEEDTGFGNMFWEMGTESMRDFFSAVRKFQPRSLTLTQEVLAERERLEAAVEGLQPQIQMGCSKLDELREEQRILEQHEADIEGNKDFTYMVEVQKSRKIDVPEGTYITNCSRCHYTCHYPCYIADDSKKAGCAAMTGEASDRVCGVCPGNCIWNVHFNQAYRFEYYSEKETRKYSELEIRYNDATGKKLTVEQVFKKHQEEFVAVQQCVYQLITESHRCLKRLEEIALRPNPLSTLDYVDLMIEAEKREGKPGWSARVNALEGMRKEAEIMSQIKEADFNPFKQYEESFVGKGMKTKGAWGGFINFISAPFRSGN